MNNKNILIGAIVLGIIVIVMMQGNFLGVITGSETLTRTASVTTISPGQTFTLNYNAGSVSGNWGASIQDSVTNCKFPSGANPYKTVMLSEDGNTKSITITAPSTAGTCTFTGDYQFGSSTLRTFSSLSVSVCAPATCTSLSKQCGSWANGCGTNLNCGTCTSPNTCNPNGQCVCTPSCVRPSDLCLASSSNGCSGTCTWTVTKNGAGDTNCDSIVSRTEIGTSINNWIAGTMTRSDLGNAIQAWANA